jgi:hypothetical protein
MEDFIKTFDKISVKYDNVILIGDLNYNVLDETNLNCLLKYCKSLQDLLILAFHFVVTGM